MAIYARMTRCAWCVCPSIQERALADQRRIAKLERDLDEREERMKHVVEEREVNIDRRALYESSRTFASILHILQAVIWVYMGIWVFLSSKIFI